MPHGNNSLSRLESPKFNNIRPVRICRQLLLKTSGSLIDLTRSFFLWPLMFSKIHNVAQQVNQIVVGKEHQVRQALVCLLAGGHLLIEDVPGVGKTTLAHALALSLGLQFNRVQFTSDLLPADVIGVSVFDRDTSAFVFHPGPIFTQVLLGMKSIAPHRKLNRHCSKQWKNGRYRPMA